MITFPCFLLQKNSHGSFDGVRINDAHSFHRVITKELVKQKKYDGTFSFENAEKYIKKLGWEYKALK